MYPEGHRASGTPGTPRCRDPPNPCLSFPLWQHLPPAPPPPPTLLRAAPAPEGLKAEGVAGGELPKPPAAIKLPLSGSPAGCGGVSPFPRHTMAHCPRYCPGSPSLAAPGTSPPTPPPPPHHQPHGETEARSTHHEWAASPAPRHPPVPPGWSEPRRGGPESPPWRTVGARCGGTRGPSPPTQSREGCWGGGMGWEPDAWVPPAAPPPARQDPVGAGRSPLGNGAGLGGQRPAGPPLSPTPGCCWSR